MFDVVLNVIEEREKVTTTGNEMINELNKVIETIKQIIKEGENSKKKLKVINDQLVDEIKGLRKKEMKGKVAKKEEEIKEIILDYEK